MLKWVSCIALGLLAGCQAPSSLQEQHNYVLETALQSRAQESRIRFLVIHYTAEDFATSLNILTDDHVSAHYLIPAHPPLQHGKPLAWQLVPESHAAWHAGASSWRGFSRLNNSSIGIEIENAGYQRTLTGYTWAPFPTSQIQLVTAIARDIVERYQIAPQNVVAHSDIAPQRKQDPGPLFPWRLLAQAGVGAWPEARRVTFYLKGRQSTEPVDEAILLEKLSRYGYSVPETMTAREKQQVIAAFQMHFRPENYQGQPDAQSEAIIDALLEKYSRR
ncbi:putative N-acetylmuramoyl-L-alanine amidase [Pectobacterium atrosepticum SCRI1043]|uniref:N-acetylmuramoyl-L-alanine amidase n=1 Tax=Pectobacterium atrosepticum (strain SCRI 1043 / ATCC BAA-672) TaxID=218491 RepID=Q6D3S9_PECAS|nr:N-acetylmuramoyl-L-alanine amidase [Pectobacterium atrosepticum]MCL6315347.1 N-acetylmuramoyl-L-alanine amidase [Pectobacterium atrosepticum]MCL6320418.1 N-acetylmuramoyl-L-alanine amidase [Pectobacterium atrosepticum]CAG75565.1 putative N-acetylmuramoyl-L-alanine amidase [Pectobacterium atrosepticum SCRI1043]